MTTSIRKHFVNTTGQGLTDIQINYYNDVFRHATALLRVRLEYRYKLIDVSMSQGADIDLTFIVSTAEYLASYNEFARGYGLFFKMADFKE